MARVIQTELKDRLVDDLLFGSPAKGGRVLVDRGEQGLVFRVQAPDRTPRPSDPVETTT